LYRLNEDFVFPEDDLDDVIDDYEDREFFKETFDEESEQFVGGYYPDRVDYKLDDKGFMITDEDGNPIPDDGFIKRTLRKISPVIKKGFNKLVNPAEGLIGKAPVAPLPETPDVKVQMASANTAKDPITGLTQTQDALLSESDKAYYKNKRTV